MIVTLVLCLCLVGSVQGWASAENQVFPPFWEGPSDSQVPKVYGRYAGGYYEFFVQGSGLEASSEIQLDLNKDGTLDAKFVMDVDVQSITLVKVGDGSTLYTVPGGDIKSLSTGTMEFRVTRSQLESSTGVSGIDDLYLRVKIKYGAGQVADAPFGTKLYALYEDVACTKTFEQRVALVYSSDMEKAYYSDQQYTVLYLTAQSELFQAGIPYDRLSLEEFLDVSRSCKYKVVIIPYLRSIRPAQVLPFRKALYFYLHKNGAGLIYSGELASNSITDGSSFPNTYYTQSSMTGISPTNWVSNILSVSVYVSDVSIFKDYSLNEEIMNKDQLGAFISYYSQSEDGYTVVAHCKKTYEKPAGTFKTINAVMASQIGNTRIMHFSGPEEFLNAHLIWRAVRWIVGEDVIGGLVLSRHSSIMAMRNDLDQSMFIEEAVTVEPYMYDNYLLPWYNTYNFVGSHYINIGDRPQDAYNEETDWDWAREVYGKFMEIESEMGSHSYSHPHNINALTESELQYEFQEAERVIMTELGLSRLGTAQPGVGDNLRTARIIEKLLSHYWSSGYAYASPGAFGYLDNDSPLVYLVPNLWFDFNLIENPFGYDPETAKQTWLDQWASRIKGANVPIVHWPIHDYGVIDWDWDNYVARGRGKYSEEMFEALIAQCYSDNAEFITGMQLHDRIRAYSNASLNIEPLATPGEYAVSASALGQDASGTNSLGAMAVKMIDMGPNMIHSVTGHYAYNDEQILLPRVGGSFTVKVSGTPNPDPPTHVRKLDMRMELISMSSANGIDLQFTIKGRGKVDLYLKQGVEFQVQGADSVEMNDRMATLTFSTYDTHTVTASRASTSAPTNLPTSNPTMGPTQNPTSNPTIGPTQNPTISPTGGPSVSPSMNPTKAPNLNPTKSPLSVGTTDSPPGAQESGSSVGVVVGSVGGVCAAVAVLAVLFFAFARRKNALAVGAPQAHEDIL